MSAAALESKIAAVLVSMADRLAAADVRWCVVGSAGRVLLGGVDTVGDLDIVVPDADVSRLEDAFGVICRPCDRPFPGRSARISHEGIVVEFFAAAPAAQDDGRAPADTATWAYSREVEVLGRSVPVGPPEDAVVAALASGDWPRLVRLAAAGGPPPRLDYLASRLTAVASA